MSLYGISLIWKLFQVSYGSWLVYISLFLSYISLFYDIDEKIRWTPTWSVITLSIFWVPYRGRAFIHTRPSLETKTYGSYRTYIITVSRRFCWKIIYIWIESINIHTKHLLRDISITWHFMWLWIVFICVKRRHENIIG